MITAQAKVNPTILNYMGKRAMEYYNRGAYEKAAVLLGRLVEQKPECTKARTFYGLSLFWLKRFDDAIAVLEECLAGDMIFRDMPLYLAYSYYISGDLKSTLSICENFLLDGRVSEECARCAQVLWGMCQEAMKQKHAGTKSRRFQRVNGRFNIFDKLLMREREAIRYF
jgi:tetratricopeptide (TPR) repeat protein